MNGTLDIAQLLLSAGANINMKSINYQNIDILLFLIKIFLNTKRILYYKNEMPIHIAVKNHHTNSKEMIELLLSKGADINAKDFFYNKTKHYFEKRKTTKINGNKKETIICQFIKQLKLGLLRIVHFYFQKE